VSQPLAATLAARRDGGTKLLVAYLMAGSTPDWIQTAASLVDAGVDAIEVGLAFSDPIIDGPVIQAAATRALERSTTFASVMAALDAADLGVPLVAMTYLNVVARNGYEATAARLAGAGCTGVILPDLPLEELDRWHVAARPAGLATVLLAAPSSTPERLDLLCARTEGFVYAVGRMATTGETDRLDPKGIELVGALRHRTTLPICLGVGVSSPAHAKEAAQVADGVVVGSAIVRRMLEGATPSEVGAFAASLRRALDE
jgi:tryptophan synthase alpha chain